MKIRSGKLWWKIPQFLLASFTLGALALALLDNAAQRAVEQTRRSLRAQGFKTDLSEFNFSTTTEAQARESALTGLVPGSRAVPVNPYLRNPSGNFPGERNDSPDLMMQAGRGVIVIWKQDWFPSSNEEGEWNAMRGMLNEDELDSACAAVLSGPIRFHLDASRGSAMLLPHLASLKRIELGLGYRTLLELHDHNPDSAWTNLLAATRLVTAWEIEPAEISHLVRMACITLAYNETWQALQSDWPEERLAAIQREWESVDFFKNVPDMVAFQRACAANMCEQQRRESLDLDTSFPAILRDATRSPKDAWMDVKYIWSAVRYRSHGSYVDENDLLLFYQNREMEMRRAISAGNWQVMRDLPGVTNVVQFFSKYRRSKVQVFLSIHETGAAFQRGRRSFLARAAEAETRRRLILTAIALERFRNRHGSYPKNLGEFASSTNAPLCVDFMNGQPLHYQTTPDGHFVLYSVGLDCTDNGGKVGWSDADRQRFDPEMLALYGPPESDIVWPKPASNSELEQWRHDRLARRRNDAEQREEIQAEEYWRLTAVFQAQAARLFEIPPPLVPENLTYGTRSLADVLRNKSTDTNNISLAEMLTPHHIATPAEPEAVTFTLPISFDALTNIGVLYLTVDGSKPDSTEDLLQKVQCSRTPNGDCLLTWSTIYETSGLHALRAVLQLNGQETIIEGPIFSFPITNLCQFSPGSAMYNPETGAILHAKLAEPRADYSIELTLTNGEPLKTISGSTSNGQINVFWNLVDDQGRKLTGETFNSLFHITLPESGRSQTLRGP